MARPTGLLALAALPLARCSNLFPCSEKPTYTNTSCPANTRVACWSLEPSVKWVCWEAAPQWFSGPMPGTPGDVSCQAQRTPAGSQRGFYDGACTYGSEMLSWDAAYEKADATLANMEEEEKYKLLNGVGWHWPPYNGWWDLKKWWYVGNTQPVPRLGIPSLNMQDSAGGFRTYWEELVGTVTSWPSQLALAATWDPELVRAYAAALGVEFRGKGANVILGPSINVHRVARGGRNFEYLSGEDPYLGARLAEAWVRGVQSQGVMAVMKHWIFNEQETNRDTEDSIVDAKTSWELYYPPFKAAIDAGVSAAMCSYNKENGFHSCSNEKQLGILKNQLGFRGFVQSDWWALHTMGLQKGTDQDMPGTADPGIGMTSTCSPPKCKNTSSWFMPEILKRQSRGAVDEAARRILASIYHLNLGSTCTPPECESWFTRNVTSPKHAALSRYIAAESIVLLKNEGVLPLPGQGVQSIAIVGEAAVAEPYDPAGLGQGEGVWNQGDYYSGGGSGHVVAGHVVTPLAGISARASLAGLKVLSSTTNSTAKAVVAAQQADLTVVVAATTGQEAKDRPNLNLDSDVDSLIAAVADVSKRVVVLMQIPGAVLTPWRDSVQGILALFLGGQATGDAWADVLFGDHAPGGRLPVTMPISEEDTILPGTEEKVPYAEGLRTGYRNKAFKAAYPFGHGLSYTNFTYQPPTSTDCGGVGGHDVCLRLRLHNSGQVAARATPQLYVEFPAEADHPAPLLKGFQKTPVMLPGSTQEVSFRLTDEELRFYDAASDSWVRPTFVSAHVGDSSADIQHKLPLEVGGPGRRRSFHFLPVALLLLASCLLLALVMWRCKPKGEREVCDEGSESDEDSESKEDTV